MCLCFLFAFVLYVLCVSCLFLIMLFAGCLNLLYFYLDGASVPDRPKQGPVRGGALRLVF